MKKKKIIFITIVSIALLATGLLGCNKDTTKKTESSQSIVSSWKEVPITEGKVYSKCNGMEDFDLKKIISNTDYTFCGEVIDEKEYEVKWTDEKGELWGPFPSSVIEVKIDHTYFSDINYKKDTIKVYYPYSLSTDFKGAFSIKKGSKYIFITKALDQDFVKMKEKSAPNDHFNQENYADVYISNPYYDIMLIKNENVYMYNEYLSWDQNFVEQSNDICKKINDKNLKEFLKTGWLIGANKKMFDKSFLELMHNTEKLQNADMLSKQK